MMSRIVTMAVLAALTPALAQAGGMHTHEHGHDHEAAAYGEPGKTTEVSRTIAVQASDDMRYSPAAITVRRGETIKFEIKNVGKTPHEFVLGDDRSLKEHAELMRRYPDMEHDDPNMAKVAPGATATLIWKFTQAGTVEFACLIPGHYEAGMKGDIRVDAR